MFVRNKIRREEVVVLCAGRQTGLGGCDLLEDVSGRLHTYKTRECHVRCHRCNIRALQICELSFQVFPPLAFKVGVVFSCITIFE